MKKIMKGLVSIIMPAYNAELYIHQSIESVLRQTYQNWELIIVEDCSTDNTKKILELIDHPKIRIYYNNCNNGPGFNCHFASEIATGEYICRLDSDDIFTDNKLSQQVEFLNKNQDLVFLSGNAQLIDGQDNIVGERTSTYENIDLKWKILFKNPIISSTVIYRQQTCIDNNLNFNNDYGTEDYKMWCEILQFGSGKMLRNTWLKYRINPSGLTTNNSSKMLEKSLKISFENCSKLISISEKEHENVLNWYKNDQKSKDINFYLYKNLLKKYSQKQGVIQGYKFYITNLIFRNFLEKILFKFI